MHKFLLLCSATLCMFLSGLIAPVTVHAQEQMPGDQPWNLEADRLRVFQDAKVVEAWGDVVMTRGADTLRAEYARYYWDTQWAYLQGDVRAGWQGDDLQAQQAEFDLENQVGWIDDGRLFFSEANIYISGDLERTGPKHYRFSDATITSCEDQPASWSFFSRQGDVTVDEYATLRSSRFQIKGTPVLYTPYMIVPVKTERQSGFLAPELTTSSRNGYGVNIPYYWAVNEETDVTLYQNFMSERGYMQGIEYRHTPNLETKGLWRASFLYDTQTAATEADEGDQFQGDGLVRPDHERYWLRGKYSGYIGSPAWKTELDIDWVSDQNYLREFNEGYSGFEESREDFLDYFGRDIDDADDLIRTNSWLVRRVWNISELNVLTEYNENLRYMNGNTPLSQDPTLQRLPEVDLALYRTKLLNTPLEVKAQTEGVNFWRRFGTTGTRLDIHPTMLLPVDIGPFSLTPSLGWRETVYLVDRFENDPAGVNTDDRVQFRGIPDAHLDGFTQLFRIFTLQEPPRLDNGVPGEEKWTKFRHNLQTRVGWDYIPDQDQSEYPLFTSADRISPRNELTYSLVNIFTGRKDFIPPAVDDTPAPELQTAYLEFLRIRLEQSYDFREASRDRDQDPFSQRPFSDLMTEVVYTPGKFLFLDSRTFFSLYSGRITEHEHMARLFSPGRGAVYFGLDFLEDVDDDFRRQGQEELHILRLGGNALLGPRWRFGVDHRYDLEAGEELETVLTLGFNHQCYFLELQYIHTPFEDRVEFEIELLGL
ncbi:MAG: LPS-assembly protein LptD [Desulfovibrionales bacterium]